MEHFDDMLRNSIANDYPENRFEFREEYWQQAQALIESYERKRKRRAIFWIFNGLLLSTVTVWYMYNDNQPGPIKPDVQHTTQQTLEQPMAVVQEPAKGATGTNHQTLPSLTESSDTRPYTTPSSTDVLTNNTQQNNNTEKQLIHTINTENKTSAATANGPSQKTVLLTPQPGFQPDAYSFSPEQPGAANSAAAPGRETVLTVEMIEPLALQFVTSVAAAELPELAKTPVTSSEVGTTGNSITQKAQEHKWHAGLTAFAGNSGKTIGKENFSFGLGIVNQFRINRKWSVNADLLWRRRNAPLSSSSTNIPVLPSLGELIDEEQVITYSFGYNQTRTTTSLKAIHFAEVPVYVSRHFGKWAIDAGGMVTTPLLSKTYTERNESSSLNRVEYTSGEATQYRLNTNHIRSSIIPGLVAGINFEPFRNLSVGVRGTYNLAKNDYTLSFSGENTDPLKLNRSLMPFSADLRVKWLF